MTLIKLIPKESLKDLRISLFKRPSFIIVIHNYITENPSSMYEHLP